MERAATTNVRYWHLADIEEQPINVRFRGKGGHHAASFRPLHQLRLFAILFTNDWSWAAYMHRHRPMAFLISLTLAVAFFACAASAQVPGPMKATAPEKMMPIDKAQKMRECEKRADQQNIKVEDRSRFVNECVAARAK